MDDSVPSVSRRKLLAGSGVAAAGALSGCSDRLWMAAEQSPHDQVSMTIKTLPDDDDPIAVRIASQLADNLRTAGIDAMHELIDETTLYREVLLRGDFDLFVARHPGYDDFDALRSMLHSDFRNEWGWQNPFRYSNGTVDELLEEQSRSEEFRRQSVFEELFETIGGVAPFTAVAFPQHIGATASRLNVSDAPRKPLDYLALIADQSAGSDSGADDDADLRVGVVDQTVTERLNPIAVDVGEIDEILGLIYDPLVRATDEGDALWLADDVEWNHPQGAGSLEVTVRLREGVTWHDGESLDADDVEFTVEFLHDTSLGEADNPIPAPRYRGRATLIEDVTVLDDRRVEFSFGDRTQEVAKRALTLPLLPQHIWEPRTDPIENYLTDALDWDNEEPVGAGLYAFEESSQHEYIALEPHDEHVLNGTTVRNHPDVFDRTTFTGRIEFHVAPNAPVAIDSIEAGDLDFLATSLGSNEVDVAKESGETSVLSAQTRSFYLVGYNLQHPELTNPRFRRVISRLVDREQVVDHEEFFDGYATAASSVETSLGIEPGRWDHSETPQIDLEFPGSDGEIDPDAVRTLFEEAGYRYDDDELVA